MTNEQKQSYIAALLRERQHYITYDKPERVKDVDAALAAVGHKAETPAKRSLKATPKAHTEL